MFRSIWLPAIGFALAACGTENDQRPRSVEYVTQAILAPSCGNAQCHSQFKNAAGFTFDSVDTAQASLAGGLVGSVSLNALNEAVGDAESSLLLNVLTRTRERMPYDQPLPKPDIELIRRWIDFGAPGAQCNPADGDRLCVGDKLVECTETFDFGGIIQTCANGCAAGACR